MKLKTLTYSLVFVLAILPRFTLAIEPGATLPSFKTVDLDGNTIDSESFKGKVVYLDFWASWCAPCKKSLPWMKQLDEKYSARGLKIVAISEDSTLAAAKKMIDEAAAKFLVSVDEESKLATQFQPPAMPTSYLIDRGGQIHAVFKGFHDGDEALIEANIIKLLDK